MKRRKKTALSLVSLLVTAAAWVLVFWQEGILWAPVEETVAESVYIDLSPGTAEDIIALSWDYDGDSVILTRNDTDGTWYDLEDRNCPIDSELVDSLAAVLAGARATLEIQNPGDPAQYGLDKPYITLLAATENDMVTYELGNMTLKGETYLRMDKGDTVFLETGVLSPAFSLRLEDLLGSEVLPISDSNITALNVETSAGDYTLSYCTDPPEGWYGTGNGWFYLAGDTVLPMDEEATGAFCTAVADISLSDCVAWQEADMVALGLDDPQVSAELTFADGEKLLLEFGNWEESSVFVRSRNSNCAYRTDSGILDALLHPDLLSLQSRSVCLLDWTLVTGGELTIPEGTVSIERIRESSEDDPSGEPTDYILANGWTLEPDRVQMWVSRLTDLTGDPVSRTISEEETALMKLRLFLGDSDVTFSLYPYDSGHYLCRMDSRTFLVEHLSPDSLINDAEDFISST